MKNWSQEKPGGLKFQKCKKTQVFFIFLSFFHLFIIFLIIFLWFLENHQILPSARHIFLIVWSEMLQNIRNPWKSQRKWWEMIKIWKINFKKWKINDKTMKNNKWKKHMKKWGPEKPGELKSQKAKKLEFFHFFIIFSFVLSFFYGFLKIIRFCQVCVTFFSLFGRKCCKT